MDKPLAASWSDNPAQHSTDSDISVFSSTFVTSPHSSFIDTGYSATGSNSSYVLSNETFSMPNSSSSSYDSQPADLSKRPFNEGFALTDSMLAEDIGSSSLPSTSSQVHLPDGHSRQASMNSVQEVSYPKTVTESPAYQDAIAVAPSASNWNLTQTSVPQPITTYDLGLAGSSIAQPDGTSTPAAFYPREPLHVDSTQDITPYGYSHSAQLVKPATLTNLPMSSVSSIGHYHSSPSVGIPSAIAGITPRPLASSHGGRQGTTEQAGKSSQASNSRGSTSGSTRRAKFRRSRTGCMICRKRKVKCDQDGEPCKQCRIGKRECHYEENPPKRKRKSKNEGEQLRKSKGSPGVVDSEPKSIKAEVEQDLSPTLSAPAGDASENQLYADTGSIGKRIKEEEEETQRAREAAEELKRTTDALFAQHTNIDQVGIEDEEDVKDHTGTSERLEGLKTEDPVETFSLQYTNEEDSIDSLDQWTTQSNQTGTLTEDWTSTTPSTGPSSNMTIEGDSLGSCNFQSLSDGTPGSAPLDEKSRIDSPFGSFLGLDQADGENVVTIENGIEESSWYDDQSAMIETSVGLGLGMAGGMMS